MTTAIWLTLLAIILLMIISGYFSGSETALTAASRGRMHQLEKNGNRNAGIVARLMQTQERLIGAILLGNNLVNILSSALATSLFIRLFGETGVVYATLTMTLAVVIFAEVLPKTWAIGNPDSFALRVAPSIRVITTLFGPFVIAIEKLVQRLLKAFGANVSNETTALSAREELRGAVDLFHQEGSVFKDDRDRLGGILDLRELDVSDVMIHRTKMLSLDIDQPNEDLVHQILSSPFTRIPLWQGESDNIVGILHSKDLLRALHAVNNAAEKLDFSKTAADPWFVPDTTTLQDQLNAFLKRKAHFAVVVDEYGEVQGIITLEDILEEIVGDIADEHDVEMQGVRMQTDGSVLAEGSVTVRDLNRACDWELPDEEATTIAGLVIHEAQTIPEIGQVFTFHGFRFTVQRRQRNQITLLRITPLGAVRSSISD